MRRIVSIAVAAVMLVTAIAAAGCGSAASNPTKPVEAGQSAACLTNQKTFESQVAVWSAASPGTVVPGSLNDLVSAGVVSESPACPNGGAYTWDGNAGTLSCSVHGHWE